MLMVIAIRILEGIFVVGMAGCVLVLILSGIDDLRVLFDRDHAPAPPMHAADSHPSIHPESASLAHR